MDVLGQHPDAFPAHRDDSDKETPLVDENADLPKEAKGVLYFLNETEDPTLIQYHDSCNNCVGQRHIFIY
jgi:hypothetical protein